MSKIIPIFIALFVGLLVTITAQANLTGKAYDVKTNELIYIESHSTETQGQQQNRLTSYHDPNGNLIARRIVTYNNNQVSYYQLEQVSIDYAETVQRYDDRIDITVLENTQDISKNSTITDAQDVIIDAGFSDFIVRNWDLLLEGDPIKFQFVSTSRMDVVNLQIRLAEQTEDTVMFSMTAANPILRMLLTPISVAYTIEAREIAYYKGVSNIQDANGDYYDVEIRYE